jgi:hypothetical protein
MSDVYADILETLTSGLYNDVKYAVREYLQNAYDAIIQAKSENLPLIDDSYRVNVEIPKHNNLITISDNGVGMDLSLLREYTSIGGGTKYSPEYAGHKGIGKLSGLRFFNDFKVISKVHGSTVAHELHWKCGEMMRVVIAEKERMKRTPYRDFIKEFFEINEIKGEEKEKHYTQIQLINVTKEFRDQVSEERIGSFIKQNCPVPFYTDKFQYSDKIAKWLGKDLFFIDTFINEKVIYQFYNDDYRLTTPQLIDVKYDDEIHAKAWFSWINNTAETMDDDRIRGIRFRCKGLCVGDNNLFANNCMPHGRDQLANWFTGEIIVIDENIIPSAARDKFYEGEQVQRLFTELRNKIGKELSLIANTRSEINAAETDYNTIKNMENESKTIPAGRLRRLSERIKDLERYQARDKYGFDFNIIQKLKRILEDEETRDDDHKNSKKNDTDDIINQGTEAIIDKLLELKEQEVNAFSRKVQAKKREQIAELRQHVVSPPNSKRRIFSEADLEVLLTVFMKYLGGKHYSYDNEELRVFLNNELRGG